MLLLDCRVERKKTQVVSQQTYDQAFHKIRQLPPTVKHLVVLLGVVRTFLTALSIQIPKSSNFKFLNLRIAVRIALAHILSSHGVRRRVSSKQNQPPHPPR